MTYLLLDNNLSRKIPSHVRNLYHDMHHVWDTGLHDQDDVYIWTYVKARSGAILTKDADFNQLLNRFGHPLKVIWLRMGNTTTVRIIQTLVDKVHVINLFLTDPALGLLEIY